MNNLLIIYTEGRKQHRFLRYILWRCVKHKTMIVTTHNCKDNAKIEAILTSRFKWIFIFKVKVTFCNFCLTEDWNIKLYIFLQSTEIKIKGYSICFSKPMGSSQRVVSLKKLSKGVHHQFSSSWDIFSKQTVGWKIFRNTSIPPPPHPQK